ncbi:hypothetical protein L484_014389 [Morus notabilis]|uniref:FAS1 domain-containing protein n=1 Tax=Morus notabilis TaxID=981085 RepID=W9SC92_9ROSA|nr:fasciclin-like arabinogalactan protein 12 [Morus notabilis]EXB98547.1 hypothetical protein L484_014389 [Morus notabilis]
MTSKNAFISFSFLIIFIISYHFSTTVAQSPAQAPSQDHPPSQTTTSPAQAPTTVPLVQAPPAKAQRRTGPTNATEILEKAGGFSVFIRLLRSTDVITQIENNLNASNSVTILAPTNGGFSALKPGTLNTLSPQQKTQLIGYHVLPTFIALQNFQTLTNPIHTQASNTRGFQLNITTDGSSVNISTGVINTTISGTVYSDNQLAIYRVDSVLLPKAIFASKESSPAPAPGPVAVKPKKESSSSSSSSSTTSASSSGSPSSSSSSKPSSGSAAAAAAAAAEPEGQVAESDTSGVFKTTGNSVMSVGLALVTAVFMLSRFNQFA